jgi:superfamily I DNA/RNA helicase
MAVSVSPDEAIYGLPGTGKTTTLLDIFEDETENGLRPTDIAAVTFRKAMAEEFRERAEQRVGEALPDSHWVKTVHAACLRLSEIMPEEVVEDGHRYEVCKTVGVPFLGGGPDDDEDEERPPWMRVSKNDSSAVGNQLFSLRSRCIQTFRDPVDGWRDLPTIAPNLRQYLGRSPGLVARFNDEYERYKDENGLSDYDDMLREVYDDGLAPSVEVLIEDEYQDKTPLQVAIHDQWADRAQRVYVAGDDNQALYGFMGTDPQFMIDALDASQKTRVLNKSYRSGPDLWNFAVSILKNAGVRDIPDIEPVGESNVSRVSFSEYRDMLSDIPEEDTFHLVRANYMGETMGEALQQAGVPFKNLRHGVRWTGRMYHLYNAAAALVGILEASRDEFGEPDFSELSLASLRELLRPLPAAMFAGQKNQQQKRGLLDVASEADDVDVSGWFNAAEMMPLIEKPTPFAAMNPSGIGSESVRERLREAWELRDGAPIGDLTHRITTIHGSKGSEADTVGSSQLRSQQIL